MAKKNIIIIIAIALLWGIFLIWASLETTRFSKGAKPKGKQISQKSESKNKDLPKAADSPDATPILVRTFIVKKVDFDDMLPVMGSIKGENEIILKFEIQGVIKKINFDEGEIIKQGDVIASLDPKDARLKLAYASNKLKAADASHRAYQEKLELHKSLFEAKAIIKTKLAEIEAETESAKHQVESARSEKELAEEDLKKTFMYAPIDGIMGPLTDEAEEGGFVTPQDKIGSLLSIDKVFVEVGIVERDIDKIRPGQRAKVAVDAYTDTPFEGKIERVFPVVEGKSRTLTAKIRVENPKGQLLPGMFARTEIYLKELKDAMLVPSVALIPMGPGIYILPVIPQETLDTETGSETGKVILKQVDVGYLTTDFAEIKKGVEVGDLVITEAQGKLKDKAFVKIIGKEEVRF
ncbi:MAG: efflux RND transporter periplasmic adaptor subunit [Candidatus Omnitrophica bacterium]|nr:efflux RND transporter periplasmic adaptor subunit [Candidatus Omnitrophota bacterium]